MDENKRWSNKVKDKEEEFTVDMVQMFCTKLDLY